jgi:L-ascorbate metabolism protein UlaG (beta-lactamase superfamily)
MWTMPTPEMTLTYSGGPTVLIDLGGLRLLIDPTFDPGGTLYPTTAYTLQKTADSALSPDTIGHLDAVLLSHDHHFDNLDHAGRAILDRAERVLTTEAGASRLGGRAIGLAPWQQIDLATPSGRVLTVTATPARHGPAGGDRGPVVGFVLALSDQPERAVYVSGDTVWFDGVAEVSKHFSIGVVLLFLGAARVAAAGPSHLTMTAEEGVEAARVFPGALIVPAHFEGWAHFSQGRSEIERAFADADLASRVRWLEPGRATRLPL